MNYIKKIRKGIWIETVLIISCVSVFCLKNDKEKTEPVSEQIQEQSIETAATGDYIKWVDFDVCYEALCKAYEWDVKTHGERKELHWIELLAYAGTKTGGKVNKSACKYIDSLAEAVVNGETTLEETVEDLEYYPYYFEASARINWF